MLLGARTSTTPSPTRGVTTVVDNDHMVGIASREHRLDACLQHRCLGGKRDDDHRKHQAIRSHQVDGPSAISRRGRGWRRYQRLARDTTLFLK